VIESLTLSNFQAHPSLVIDLDPYVTCLTGPSDQGKSAIIRALRWLCLNQPSGEAFIRDGAKQALVEIKVDGRVVHRVRGKGQNEYQLGMDPIKEFKALGNGNVPPEVATLLNVGILNFQGQHDAPFWFGETAGEVSRQLNQIINLGVIDDVLAKLDKGVREATTNLAVCEDRVAQAKQARQEASRAVEVDERLREVEGLEAEAADLARRSTLLGDLIQNVGEYQAAYERASQANVAALRAVAVGNAWAELDAKRAELEKQINNAVGLQCDITRMRAEAAVAEKEFKTKLGATCPLCQSPINRKP
jgi:DNA repair protein SbcC/Rad50